MSINGVNGVGAYSATNTTKTTEAKTSVSKEEKKAEQKLEQKPGQNINSAAVTYSKSDTNVSGKSDTVTIVQMKAEAEQKTAQLRSLVEKMMKNQGLTFNNSTDIYELLREGKLEIDPKVAAQAKQDIAQDGYWGVEQTSERLVSFAKAFAGNDPSKAEEMMNAIEEGYKQATKSWGDELPEICKQTLDATRKKMDAWKSGIASVEE
jgi:hypothetical protein